MNKTILHTDGSDFEVASDDVQAELNKLSNLWTAGKLDVDLKLFLGYNS